MIYLNSEDISVKVTPENKLYALFSSLVGTTFVVAENKDDKPFPVDVVGEMSHTSKILSYDDNPVLNTAKISADILKSNDMSFLPESSPHEILEIQATVIDNIDVNKLMKSQYTPKTQAYIKKVLLKNYPFLSLTKGYSWFADRGYKDGLIMVHDKDKFVRLVFEAV